MVKVAELLGTIPTEVRQDGGFIPLETSELRQLCEQTLAPGNLIHGREVSLPVLQHILTGPGIQRSEDQRRAATPFSRFISLAMMSNDPLPSRYEAQHHGEISSMPSLIPVSFIVSREALFKAFPGQVYAVGDMHF